MSTKLLVWPVCDHRYEQLEHELDRKVAKWYVQIPAPNDHHRGDRLVNACCSQPVARRRPRNAQHALFKPQHAGDAFLVANIKVIVLVIVAVVCVSATESIHHHATAARNCDQAYLHRKVLKSTITRQCSEHTLSTRVVQLVTLPIGQCQFASHGGNSSWSSLRTERLSRCKHTEWRIAYCKAALQSLVMPVDCQ